MKQTSVEVRELAIKLYKNGKSLGEISHIINRCRSTVQYIISRYEKKNRVENKPKIVLNRKLSASEERWILRKVTENPEISAPKLSLEIKNYFNKEVSESTIRRVLRKNNYHYIVNKHKCYMKENNTISLEDDANNKTNDLVENEDSNCLPSISNSNHHLESEEAPSATLKIMKRTASTELMEVKADSTTKMEELQSNQEWQASSTEELGGTTLFNEKTHSFLKAEAVKIFSQWCIENQRPFNLSEDIGLRRFAELMIWIGANYGTKFNIDDVWPDATSISQSIDNQFEATFEKLKNEIAVDSKNGYGLTSKIWADSYGQQRYTSLTIHYIKNGQLISKFLGLNAVHEKQELPNTIEVQIQKILNDYNLALKDSIIVTDGGITAVNEFTQIKCINHILDNVIKNSMKEVKELENLYKQCLTVKQYLTNSLKTGNSSEIFNGVSSTKANAVYYLLNVILQNWPEIKCNLQQDNKLSEFKSINRLNLECILKILKLFENVSKILEGEERPTIHLVYACINGLKRSLSDDDNDDETMQKFKEILNENLQTLVISNLSITHKIALFLYPPANKLILFSKNERSLIKAQITLHLKAYVQNECPEIKKEFLTTSSESNDILSSYLINVITPQPNYKSCDRISNEIHSYENLNVPYENNFDILAWWNSHQKQFPLLYKLSCKILATPASCVASEAVISLVKHVGEDSTNILSNPKDLNQLIYLHLNNFSKNREIEESAKSRLYEERTTIENNVIEEI